METNYDLTKAPKDGTKILVLSGDEWYTARWSDYSDFDLSTKSPRWIVFDSDDPYNSFHIDQNDVQAWSYLPSVTK